MKQIIINVTDEELKAVNAHVEDAVKWLQDAWTGKAYECVCRITNEISDKNPNTMCHEDKISFLNDVEFEPYSPERQGKSIKDRLKRV